MSVDVRRCLGCSATYPADEHACPSCGSHAAEVEEERTVAPRGASEAKAKPKPARPRRKT
jgi:rRNA maturation endonuclease Nob1